MSQQWKERTLSQFKDILYNIEQIKDWKETYHNVDRVMNARTTILSINYTDTLVKLDYDNAGNIVEEIHDYDKYFTPVICNKIKLLKTGDVIIFPDQLAFIIINKIIRVYTGAKYCWPHGIANPAHSFSPIFDFPINYWKNINLLLRDGFYCFCMRFSSEIDYEIIQIKYTIDIEDVLEEFHYLPSQIAVFVYNNISYGVGATSFRRDKDGNLKSLGVSFDNCTVDFMCKNSNLKQIMSEYKLDVNRILVESEH